MKELVRHSNFVGYLVKVRTPQTQRLAASRQMVENTMLYMAFRHRCRERLAPQAQRLVQPAAGGSR